MERVNKKNIITNLKFLLFILIIMLKILFNHINLWVILLQSIFCLGFL
jgi:hypothetical protein